MTKEEKLQKMNKELKVYINESSFISQKCRNKLLHYFEEEFHVDLDIGSYQNVDLQIQEDFTIIYREDTYTSKEEIHSMEELEERYHRFREKADTLIRRKDVDFQGRRNFNNLTNLILVVCLFLLMIAFILLGIHAFLVGKYFDCLWLVVVVAPWLFPKLKSNLQSRLIQAKQYIKSLLKKVK